MGMPPEMLQAMMAQQGGQPPMDPMQGGMGGQPPVDPSMMGQPPQQPPTEGYGGGEEGDKDLDFAFSEANLAKKLHKSAKGKKLLDEIGIEVVRGFKEDEASRKDWIEKNERWLKMAMLVREGRTFPWPRASDVKYPLLATAAMQFSARAYPALVPSDGQIVKVKAPQHTVAPETYAAASRVSNHMSYQLLNRMPNWEEDMDKLLMTMAISGICFKKTYYSAIDKCHYSNLVYPENFVVNYHAKSLETAYRKSEILKIYKNEYEEKVRDDEFFLDVDLPSPGTDDNDNKPTVTVDGTPPPIDRSTPHLFIACHTYWDLDDDGYEEPYVIWVHKASNQVVRIIARYDSGGIKRDAENKIIKIEPVEYFTAFPFIPNPDGSIYALGFGILLGPLNEAVNTLVNQLVDAGTLSNLQSGFIGKGLHLKMGDTSLRPGEFKVVNATGEALSKLIYPMPVREPSAVLFQLLNLLITSGNQLASIAEIFVGKMPGQNTPATTTQETIQQGMAVFTAIYKRVYRSLAQEFKKLFRLNSICPDIIDEESDLAGIPLQASDYDMPHHMICPGADPTGDSQTVRMNKLQQAGQLIQLGTINPQEFTKRMLEGLEIANPQELMMQPQEPPPDPKMETEKLKQQTEQLKQQGMQIKNQGAAQQMDKKAEMMERQAAVDAVKAQGEVQHKAQLQAVEAQGARSKLEHDQVSQTIERRHQTAKGQLDVVATAAKHRLAMRQAHEAHQQKQKQAKESQPKTKG